MPYTEPVSWSFVTECDSGKNGEMHFGVGDEAASSLFYTSPKEKVDQETFRQLSSYHHQCTKH